MPTGLPSGSLIANPACIGESIDLYADFKRAFGEEPGPITGIGIMTDTDNTGEKARAWYGDIRLLRAPH